MTCRETDPRVVDRVVLRIGNRHARHVRHVRHVRHARRPRAGVALVTILALLALSAALLAGGFASATASARAARSSRAALVASAATRRTLGAALQGWGGAEDALAIGASIEREASVSSELPRDAADTRVRIQRLSATLFVIAADVVVPARGVPLARRRMRLLVRRSASADSTVVTPPRAVSRWALGELF